MTRALSRAAAAGAGLCRGVAAVTATRRGVQRSRPPLQHGQTAVSTRRVTETDLRVFGALCGDDNPVHSKGVPSGEPESATRRVLVHGAFLNALASGVIGSQLPGPGTIVVGQNLRFPRPCLVGDEVTTTVEVKAVRKIVEVTYRCVADADSDDPRLVLEGNAKLILASVDED